MKKLLLLFTLCVTMLTTTAAADVTVVLQQNFAAFTGGSEDAPANVDISSALGGNKLRNTLAGWTGKSVYEAGGKLEIADGGNLQTASFNARANSGIVKITARVRMMAETGGIVKLSFGYSKTQQTIITDREWHDVVFITDGGGGYSYVKVEPYLTFPGILIDEIKVEQSADFFPVPDPNQPSNANGTSFTATWSRVSGATGYLLDVYSKNGQEKEYVLHNESVTTTSKRVTGLDATKKYFFTVRATNGTATSDYSEEIEVVKVIYSLAAPEALKPTDVKANSFTANFSPVADATSYLVNVYSKKVCNAGVIDLLDEDFSKVTKGTLTSVEFSKSQEYLDAYTHTSGWYGVNHALAQGYMVLAPFGSSGASVTTPYADYSNDGGKLTLIARMASVNYGQNVDQDTVTIQLVDADDNVLEEQKIALTAGFKDYTVEFTKGAKETAVKFFYGGHYKIFLDSVTIRQQVAEGYILTESIDQKETTATSCQITVPEPITSKHYYAYTVQAVAPTVESGEITDIISEASAMVDVAAPTGIGAITHTASPVVKTVYYNAAGAASSVPFNGLNIVVSRHADGTVTTTKAIKAGR